MILTYDSILGIPIIEGGGENTNTNNSGINIGVPSILLLIVVIGLFVILFSTLGKNSSSTEELSGNGSSKLLTILLGGVLIVVVLLNGLQYFFDINLTAQLNNLFTETPSIDLTVEQPGTGPSDIAPVPEIKIKEQVFHIPGNKYTYDNADALCKAYGSRLATYNEIEKAYKNGGEWCSYGWSDRQLALFPTQKDTWNYLQNVEGHENDCGRAGINGGYIANPNVRFGANCYGYKPKITDEELEKMQTEPLYPRTAKDVKEEKRIEFWRRRIPEILVAPFNKNVWSLL
tara:strand:+ start:687 stop:1550 length:864 start_codon:yes stop_codon:yes gene_type:complete